MSERPAPGEENHYLSEHVLLLVGSYRRLLGVPLLEAPQANSEQLAQLVYEAPFALVSHDTSDDPVFNYANRTALELFEMGWDEFTRLPSRKSAEPLRREERAALLQRVTEQGYIDDYSGVRISSRGRRFRIERAVVWNLYGDSGLYRGQAAVFSDWTPLDDDLAET